MHISIDHPTNRANFSEVTIGKLTIWFSYRIAIAFGGLGKLVCRQNDWAQATGKHMAEIGVPKSDRLPGDEFEAALAKALKKAG